MSTLRRFKVTTESGSVYFFRLDDQHQAWVSAHNVGNDHSTVYPSGKEYRVEIKHMVLGDSMLFVAPKEYALDDPRRVPGGGKLTTPILKLEDIR